VKHHAARLAWCVLVFASFGASLLAGAQRGSDFGPKSFVSILIPLSYNEHCWSSVTLTNLRDRIVDVDVEAHDGGGALLPLSGAATMPLHLGAGQKVALRLQIEEADSTDAWVKVSEHLEGTDASPGVSVRGTSECLVDEVLTTTPRAVAFPTRNPWIEADSGDFRGKTLVVVNAAPTPAALQACYSTGSHVEIPRENGNGARELPVCSATKTLFLPPFGLQLIPVTVESSSTFSIQTRGSSIVLMVLKPQADKKKQYSVDSSISFHDPSAAQ
jgi:hypothetical protein